MGRATALLSTWPSRRLVLLCDLPRRRTTPWRSRCRASASGGTSRSSRCSSSRRCSRSSTSRCRCGPRRWLLPAGIGVAVLAALLQIVGLDVLANFAKLGAVTLLAWWFLGFFETAAWVMVVALIIPWVDAVSVWRGPTKHIVTHQRELFTTFSFAFPVPGEANTAQLGLPDLLFFALFLGAADRWGLRTRLTWAAMALSFGATLALDCRAGHHTAGCPRCRSSPSASSRRTRTCSGASCARTTRGAHCAPSGARPASRARAGRRSRCAACAGTCPRAAPERAGSPTPPRAP